MRGARFLLAALVALAARGCLRHEPDDVAGRGLLAPSSSSGGLLSSQGLARPQYAQQTDQQPVARPAAAPAPGERGLFSSQIFARPQYAQQAYQQPAANERGSFVARSSAPQAYAQRGLLPPSVLQYRAPRPATPQYASPQYDAGASYAAAPRSYAAATSYEQPYTLGAGDKLRVVVFGQDGISNTYIVDAGGNVSLPLIGSVPARGITAQQLSQRIAERLKQCYVREPHVTGEVETYRPFFILGEVTTPGQYPYVADMTVEKAIAIAGGFAPRALKRTVELTHTAQGQQIKSEVPLDYPLRPGDTVLVKERWF